MSNPAKTQVTVEATVNAPVEKTWKIFTDPKHIVQWNFAHPSWCCPKADHDLRVGGKFNYRMEARDGSFGFDFGGTFDVVDANSKLEYTMGDGRQVKVTFTSKGNSTHVTEVFDAESENPVEMQKGGWQAILDNFKNHAEKN